jgi:hypothetical protein
VPAIADAWIHDASTTTVTGLSAASAAASETDRRAQAIETVRIAAEQQAQREADARAQAQTQAIVAAQIATETSPDNWCHTTSVAGMLIKSYNGLSWGYPPREVIDIEHLVTITNADGVLSCHGVFVHTNNARIEGTLMFKPNVAGDIITHWAQESWQPPVQYTPPPPTYLQPPSAYVQPPAATVATSNTAFQQGLADRATWETWFGSIGGDYRSGAYFWTGQRSLAHPQSCSTLGGDATTDRPPEQLIREVVYHELRPELHRAGGLTRHITFIADDGSVG